MFIEFKSEENVPEEFAHLDQKIDPMIGTHPDLKKKTHRENKKNFKLNKAMNVGEMKTYRKAKNMKIR